MGTKFIAWGNPARHHSFRPATEGWFPMTRIRNALHALLGRPIIANVRFGGPIDLQPQRHVRVCRCELRAK